MKISCSRIFKNANPGTVGPARRTNDRRFGRSRRFKNRHEEQEKHEDIGRDEPASVRIWSSFGGQTPKHLLRYAPTNILNRIYRINKIMFCHPPRPAKGG
jgi:hypothetical protein